MRDHAKAMLWFAAAGVAVLAGVSASGGRAQADDPNSAPNPYHVVEHWAKLPEGRVWGQAIGADIDRDGTSLWVFDRCAAKTCEGSNVAPIQKFDASGHLVASFGSGMFKWPHGLFSASDGTVWVTDGANQTVVQLAPDGRVLRTLGKPGVAGDGPDEFNSPPTFSLPRTATSLWPTATAIFRYRKPTTVSLSFRKTANSSKPGATMVRDRANLMYPMLSPWTRRAACSLQTGRTTASKFSIRMENSWRNGNSSVAQAACTSAMT